MQAFRGPVVVLMATSHLFANGFPEFDAYKKNGNLKQLSQNAIEIQPSIGF